MRYYKNLACWFVVHITHWMLYIGNLLALFYTVAHAEWYIALPIITLVGNPIIGGLHCAYNNIENTYRAALGWPLIQQNFIPAAIADLKHLIHWVKSCF